jgi:ribonuclease-3
VTLKPEALARQLDYQFRSPGLLRQALTHRSVGSKNNERLEFLGDALLNCIIADALFQRFPEANEGDLSRMRAHLVKGETLAELAQELMLGDHLLLGPGELKSGGFRRNSILAGAMEAIFGAVYCDSGFNELQALILALYESRLENASIDNLRKDPKTRLQEFLQGRRLALPEYSVVSVEGQDHKQLFRVNCSVAGLGGPITGSGRSRRRAEQDAAARTLEQLEKNDI